MRHTDYEVKIYDDIYYHSRKTFLSKKEAVQWVREQKEKDVRRYNYRLFKITTEEIGL